ncbi:MAG: serine/threonine-protein kinase, partial [Myxococcota bacterium]
MTGGHDDVNPPPAVDVDRYEVDGVVGRGGMGTVYRARQVGLNRTVALKILHSQPHSDDAADFDKRFRREAETLAKFDHPNIVRIHDFGTTRSGRLFLVMELVEGPRLSDLVKDVPMPAGELLPLILQVCQGLRYAHERGAVHRDLKPGNLLVKEHPGGRRQIKIVDFGLVKLVDEEQTITREGLILGSPHYMAPEQLRGDTVDHRVDIYALGALLFRCLSGRYPFQRKNLAATMMGHLNEAVPRLSEAAPQVELPEGLEDLIARCMQKSPEDRFQTVDEVA